MTSSATSHRLSAAEPSAPPSEAHPLRSLFTGLRTDYFFLILLASVVVLSLVSTRPFAQYPGLVDWAMIATLTGLLLLTKALEERGNAGSVCGC